MKRCIHGACVITVDAHGTVYAPGAVVITDDCITDIGPCDEVLARCEHVDEFIDVRGKVLLPGFVSAHNHVGYALFRGRAEDFGHVPTHRLYLPMADIVSSDERRALGSLAIAELLRGGVTTICEMEEDADLFPPFIEQIGMRAAVGVMMNDVNLAALAAGSTVFDESVRSSSKRRRSPSAGMARRMAESVR